MAEDIQDQVQDNSNPIEKLFIIQNQLLQQIIAMQQTHYQQLEQLLVGIINQQQLLSNIGQVINLHSQAINEIHQKTNRLVLKLSDTEVIVNEIINEVVDIKSDVDALPNSFQDLHDAIKDIRIYQLPPNL